MRIDFAHRAIILGHSHWIVAIRLGTIGNGKWYFKDVLKPSWFGRHTDQRVKEYPLPNGNRRLDQRLEYWWIPYISFIYATNEKETLEIYTDEPKAT